MSKILLTCLLLSGCATLQYSRVRAEKRCMVYMVQTPVSEFTCPRPEHRMVREPGYIVCRCP